MFSLCGLFTKTIVIDTAIENINLCKYFTIVCKDPTPICDFIHTELGRSATLFTAEGTYSGQEEYIVLTVMKRSQAVQLRNYIKKVQPQAFMMITNSSEIIGAHQIELRVGLVYGPFQPIYGGGAAIITLCLYKLYKQDDIVIFVASGIIGAAFEYLCSWGQEMLFGTVSWDYSGTPFNIDGRTNLMFALIWGTLGLIWIKEIYPAMSRMIEKIPKRPGAILTILLVAFMLFDGFISCAALTRANERAEGIPATSSFQMFLDKHLDDNYLALVYPNMQKVNEDGTKSEPLKDTVKNT